MRWRLVAVLVGFVIVVLAVHDIPLASYLRDVERDRLQTQLEREAFQLGGWAEEALEGGTSSEEPFLRDLVSQFATSSGARVIITDRTGIAVITSDAEATSGRDYSTRPEIAGALQGTPSSGERFSQTLDEQLVFVAVPVRSGNDIVGTVRLTYPAQVVDDRVGSRVRGLVLVAVISALTALAVAVLLATTVTQPLRQLREATNQFAHGNLHARATVGGPPELRDLAHAFNGMADQIESVVTSQRGFNANASHQLRTPLTALRLRLDQAAELVRGDPDAALARIEAASVESDRLSRTVEGLLTIARSDAANTTTITLDAAEVLRERVVAWRPLVEERGLRLESDIPWRLAISATEHAFEHIVDNYVDNAIDVAPAGTAIDVSLALVGDRAELHVRDRGAGLRDEELALAFDRFWRGANAGPGGTGLGLAIVAQMARASGAEVELRHQEPTGVDAVARFRLAELTRVI
jgi:signal transduction histidine kinase